MKKLISLLLALVLALSLCACGGKNDPRVGTYKATSMISDGMDLLQMMQALGLEYEAYMVLKSDGTGYMDMTDEDRSEFKWTDTTISDPDGSGPMNYTFNEAEGTLVLEVDDTTMTFTKLTGDELKAYESSH